MGMDSHADTTCVNKYAYIESIIEGHKVDAIPFDQSIGKLTNLPIVNAIYAFDDPQSMRTTLLRFNQAIFIKNMENALLCPNQAREQGIIVDDVPAHFDHTGASTFSVIAGDVQLPLNQNGPTSYLHLRRPTKQELDHLYDEVIDITNEHKWNPYKTSQPTTYDVASLSHKINNDIDDWLLYRYDRSISTLKVAKPKNKLTAEYLAQM